MAVFNQDRLHQSLVDVFEEWVDHRRSISQAERQLAALRPISSGVQDNPTFDFGEMQVSAQYESVEREVEELQAKVDNDAQRVFDLLPRRIQELLTKEPKAFYLTHQSQKFDGIPVYYSLEVINGKPQIGLSDFNSGLTRLPRD